MTVADQGARLTRAEAEIRELRKGQEIIFSKLDGITAALHELRGASGPSWRDMLSVIKDGAILFGLVVGGILYLAASTNNSGMSELQTRLTRLETILSMAARPRAAPGAWMPEGALSAR